MVLEAELEKTGLTNLLKRGLANGQTLTMINQV